MRESARKFHLVKPSLRHHGFNALAEFEGSISDLGVIDHFAKRGEEGDKYRGINNSGRLVGYAETLTNRYACLWNGNELLDLNDLVERKSGWHLVSAAAINDRGQILVRAPA